MKDYRKTIKQSFPLVFGLAFVLFFWLVLPYNLEFMRFLIPIIVLLQVFSIIEMPFMSFDAHHYNPPVYLAGILFIAFLCTLVHFFHVKRILREQKWEYIGIIIVTWLQTGLLYAMSFLVHKILFGGPRVSY